MTLRILVVDDHAIVRRGVRALLEECLGWEVCGEAETGRQAVDAVRRLNPDVVILDLSLPELNGLDAARQILADAPDTQVLVLTMHRSEELARQVLLAGARGFVLKSDADQSLVEAVESVRLGLPFVTPQVADVVMEGDSGGAGSPTDIAVRRSIVSPREREILQLVAEGKTSKAIATVLAISIKTVEAHRTNLMRKLHVRSVGGLVRYAIRNGIVEA